MKKVFLFRLSFNEKRDQNRIQSFCELNQVAICLANNNEMEDFNREKASEQFIQRWRMLCETVEKEDVIIVAIYKNVCNKLGVIKKASRIIETKADDGEDRFKGFKLECVSEIPQPTENLPQGTISPLHKAQEAYNELFRNRS
jgi:hypothetical protein